MDRIDRIVAKYTANGVTDWEKVENTVNESINAITVKESEKAVNKYLAEKGFKDEAAFTTHLAEHETLKTTQTAMKAEQEKLSRDASLLELGITDPKRRAYLSFTIGQKVDDKTDWKTALEAHQKEEPEWYTAKPITTGTKVIPPVGAGTKLGFEEILAQRHPENKDLK